MKINDFVSSPAYQEAMSRFRNKTSEDSHQAFSDILTENNGQTPEITPGTPQNVIADNGVKSALLLGRLDSQRTEQKQSSGSMSTINLTDEELEGWHNGKNPEGWRFTGAGGVIFSGNKKAYDDYFNVYYTADMEYDYEFGVFYDENSTEDNSGRISAPNCNFNHIRALQ